MLNTWRKVKTATKKLFDEYYGEDGILTSRDDLVLIGDEVSYDIKDEDIPELMKTVLSSSDLDAEQREDLLYDVRKAITKRVIDEWSHRMYIKRK